MKQSLTLRYIARHCPALKDLEIRLSICSLGAAELRSVDVFAFAIQELVISCRNLENVAVQSAECRKVCLVDYLHLGDEDNYPCHGYEKSVAYYHDLLFRGDGWFTDASVRDMLDVKNILEILRDDRVYEWVKSALIERRKRWRPVMNADWTQVFRRGYRLDCFWRME
jgi:hypothetical protein